MKNEVKFFLAIKIGPNLELGDCSSKKRMYFSILDAEAKIGKIDQLKYFVRKRQNKSRNRLCLDKGSCLRDFSTCVDLPRGQLTF